MSFDTCSKLATMRRNISGLLVALLTLGVGALIVRENSPSPKTQNFGVRSYSSSDYKNMFWAWETYSSPQEATTKFNAQLQQATQYMEFTPCFDSNGRRIGERAVMHTTSPSSPQPVWRIMWTQQSADFSESFTVESPLLSEARHGETTGQEGWKKCISTKREANPK
ncbi:MAG TPA: hypothetical protein VGB76_04860 [Pyrinomonadaceae bacterium]|jgi:hypothetical protein